MLFLTGANSQLKGNALYSHSQNSPEIVSGLKVTASNITGK
jgi:hypothetical protein